MKMIYMGFSLFISLTFSFDSYSKKDTESSKVNCEKEQLALPGQKISESLGVSSDDITVPSLKYKGFVTTDELRKYDSKTIATLLVQRLTDGCDKERGGQEEKSIGEGSEVMLLANMRLWDSIGKYGFQNQHVTATTGGCDCREKRFRREARLLGSVVGYSAKGKDVLPKYSGLNILVKDHFYRKDHTNTPKQYGNSAVVFKKGINKRTTFSRDDSLSMYPFRESVVLNSMQFKPKKKKKEKFKCDSDYCEAQIWGKVGVGDVAYALIPEGKDVPSAFIAREIPVYRIKSGKKGTLGWEKGELLFDPKSKEGIGLVESEKKSIEISRFCIDCKPVVKRINDHAFFPKWDLASLKKRHAKEKNIDVKREIYGEIVQRKHESDKEKKDYIFSNYKDQSNDEISRAISLQAMATYPKDKRTKMNLLKVLGHIKDAERESSRYARWGTSKATAPEIIIALSMATEMDEFKEDKEVQKILMKAVKKFPKFKKYYDYFSNEKGLCEQ